MAGYYGFIMVVCVSPSVCLSRPMNGLILGRQELGACHLFCYSPKKVPNKFEALVGYFWGLVGYFEPKIYNEIPNKCSSVQAFCPSVHIFVLTITLVNVNEFSPNLVRALTL